MGRPLVTSSRVVSRDGWMLHKSRVKSEEMRKWPQAHLRKAGEKMISER